MPNNGRITECPFYVNERNSYITCEDTKRRFRYRKQKEDYMDKYCDTNWQQCPYAILILHAYEQEEEMLRGAKRDQKMKALEAENKKVNIMLSKAEARDNEKATQIRALQKKVRHLEHNYMLYRDKYEQMRDVEEKAMEQINEAMQLCEARVAFLLSKRRDHRIDEAEFKEWHKKHEFAIVPEIEEHDDTMDVLGWTLKARKINVKEVMEGGAEGSATEPESTGGSETESSGEAAEAAEGK